MKKLTRLLPLLMLPLLLSSCAMLPEFLQVAEEVAVETAVHSAERDINMHLDVKQKEKSVDAEL